MNIIKEEFIKYGVHKINRKAVGLLMTEYDNGSIEYWTKSVNSNEGYTFPTTNYKRALGDFAETAFSMEYWEKVKNVPKQNMETQHDVALEWEYGGIPIEVTTM